MKWMALIVLALLGLFAGAAAGKGKPPCRPRCPTTTSSTTSSSTVPTTTTSPTSTTTPTTTTTPSTTTTPPPASYPQGVWTSGSASGLTDAELAHLKALGDDFVLATPDISVPDRVA